ncbi:MAG: c-type cytochrome biogenesis protein CcsB [Deltaproteobacteria bacterium]|nr:c-type cytochrome biogenesis protein CcsB [Deltaproteobacteria bacterium]
MSGFFFFNVAAIFLFAALLLFLLFAAARKLFLGNWGRNLTLAGLLFLTLGFALRWWESYRLLGHEGHIPLTNFYESLVFFSWTVLLAFLLIDWRFRLPILGAVVTPVALLFLLAAQLTGDAAIHPLVPALKSNWLTFHVLTCFLGYAAFAVACATAVLYLIRTKEKTGGQPPTKTLLPEPELLEEVHYQAVLVGFLLLTLGILTGSAWAHRAWGSYWSWDPKETWSLIVWLIYAALLHARMVRGWGGKPLAWLSLLGFAATLFCWLGVNLLLPGLHSYGAL